jgi:hypothetical protein
VGLSIRTKSVRLDRRGRVKIKVRCSAASTENCKGTLSLTAKVKRKTLKLGKKKFNIAPGKTKSVLVKISKKGRKLIKRKRKLKASATAKAKASAGKTKTAKRKVTLKPARKKR